MISVTTSWRKKISQSGLGGGRNGRKVIKAESRACPKVQGHGISWYVCGTQLPLCAGMLTSAWRGRQSPGPALKFYKPLIKCFYKHCVNNGNLLPDDEVQGYSIKLKSGTGCDKTQRKLKGTKDTRYCCRSKAINKQHNPEMPKARR